MAGWSGLSAAARGAVLVGGAAVVAVAGYFGFARGPEAVVPVADQAAVTAVETPGPEAPAAVAGTEVTEEAAPSAESSAAQTAPVVPAAETDAALIADASAAVVADPAAAPANDTAVDAADPTEAAATDTAVTPAILPRFDVARVAPDGAATVAGQAAPGARVALLVDGVEVASAVANGQGRFAALFDVPPSPVARLLTLQATGADGVAVRGPERMALAPVAGAVDVAVAGAAAPALQAPAAVLVAPEGVKVLQPGADVPAEVAENVVVDSISYAPDGAVMLGGRANAGAGLRIYLDGLAIADVAAGSDGAWAATLKDVAAGIYTLRVDQLAADGTVTSRFETPFKRETLEALAASVPAVSADATTVVVDGAVDAAPEFAQAPSTAADNAAARVAPASPAAEVEVAAGEVAPAVEPAATDAAPVVEAAPVDATAAIPDAVPVTETAEAVEIAPAAAAAVADAAAVAVELAAVEPTAVAPAKPAPVSVTVQPGYTLWGIAQQNFGDGVMYVQVFEANKDKIKDPDLIYPGQVFTIPAAP